MEITDVSKIPQDLKMYGGMSCKKIAIVIDGIRYLMKFPGNLKSRNMKNIVLSYSNGPVCEYIGSHIYDLLGIPVHETVLAKRNQKLVVLCKDFVGKGQELFEFSKIKVSFEPVLINSDGEETDGQGSDLSETLLVLNHHPVFKGLQNVLDRFWDIFIVDAFIGNPDRNNGNWGVISDGDKVTMAPVYDNGNCLNDKWDEDKMKYFLSDKSLFEAEAYKGKVCYYTGKNGKKINPFNLIASGKYTGCTKALERIVSKIELGQIFRMIEEIPVLTDIQVCYYEEILKARAGYLADLSAKVSGKNYKVTAIAKNALKGNKKLTKLTIGANVKKIGANAFKGCSKLKNIVVKTKKLTKSKVGSNAFKGINAKATIKVPKAKVKAYKKIVKAKGAGKNVNVKK